MSSAKPRRRSAAWKLSYSARVATSAITSTSSVTRGGRPAGSVSQSAMLAPPRKITCSRTSPSARTAASSCAMLTRTAADAGGCAVPQTCARERRPERGRHRARPALPIRARRTQVAEDESRSVGCWGRALGLAGRPDRGGSGATISLASGSAPQAVGIPRVAAPSLTGCTYLSAWSRNSSAACDTT